MILPTSRSIELNGQSDPGRKAGSYAEEQAQTEAITDSEDK